MQLYTVREALQDDLQGTLNKLAEAGYTQVEPFAFTDFPGLGDALAAAGLAAPTTHVHLLGESDEKIAEIFDAARALGILTVIDPHVPAERWTTAEDIDETAAQLNHAATIAAEHGVRVGYHNHAHEFENKIEGRNALEYFVDRLDPDVVIELDTYWVAVGGENPVEVLKRLGDRVVAIHVKDGPGTKETKDQVAVGSGSLPVRDIIEAAPNALRVVELDDSRDNRFTAVIDSIAFLTKEGLA
ncbi:sugar phosphate isomerase/epimerase [Humibacter ginsenosidimutans]|uniref:Sugar phosphate isomerase/epimerase n=1 Tax=Humibacter ginsenosidimutans TaxID=2599293 RepID=A0A5B8M9W6_9MICO|nr:sugar phosphate isomerase/epimerase [Humibacter ginsenosidimutans]